MKPYVLVEAYTSRCCYCRQTTTLLQQTGCHGPMFFICWGCHKVFQAGVGEVTEEGQKPITQSEPHIVSDPNTPEAQAYSRTYWEKRMAMVAQRAQRESPGGDG